MKKKQNNHRTKRTRQKSNIKSDPNPFPQIVRREDVRRWMTPLWILSSVAFAIAALLFGLFHQKYPALWVTFVGVMLGIAAIFVWIHGTISERDSKPGGPPRFSEKVSSFTVIVGSDKMIITRNVEARRGVLHLNKDVVTARVINGRLCVDATLSSPNGDVELRDNELRNRPYNWDRNFDDSAIEIVDENRNPVFQLVYPDDQTAEVRGLFADGNDRILELILR